MELTPELLLEAKFAPARRGYDMAEVDDFLERCAEGLDVLLARLRAEFDRAEQAEDQLRAHAGGEPKATRPVEHDDPSRPDDADGTHTPATTPLPPNQDPEPAAIEVGEPMRILIAAERTAEAAVADAKAEAERIRTEAETIATTQRSEAETLLARAKAEAEAEARRAGDEAKRQIQTEVVTLRGDRDVLNDDIRSLRRWLDDQRTRLRATARDLQRLAEDPSALRDIPGPDLALTDAGGDEGVDVEAEPGDDDRPGQGAGTDEPGADALDTATGEAATATDPGRFDDDGEPTQAVPAVDGVQLFDDERDDPGDAPMS